jgi:Flp pilus assembly protein TadG
MVGGNAMRGQRREWRGQRRGAAMVEFILLLPLLMLILMAVLEFGLMARDSLLLHQACYEGVHVAALGKPVVQACQAVIKQAPPGVRPEAIVIECLPRQTNGSGEETGAWQDTWRAVSDVAGGEANDAPTGSILRVTVKAFPHRLVTGNFFRWLPNYHAQWKIDAGSEGAGGVPVLLLAGQAGQPRM